ncbi:hypothetical protein CHU98_g8169 [Xylaria longipes]|nr:hypothetical protein CHU98_g8169 [Xylaria longipes]
MLRLIDVNSLLGHYKFEFIYAENGHEAPKFVYKDIHPHEQPAFRKVLEACKNAKKLDCDYIWIDYCCIDQSDPEDVAWSINSRYQWYAEAEICLVYLPDSWAGRYPRDRMMDEQNECCCKWWLQSWTVPVILGSRELVFYDREWAQIGVFRKRPLSRRLTLDHFEEGIEDITQIAPGALLGSVSLSEYSVATKLSWASGPGPYGDETGEDVAYSVMGIFGVRMAPNYGEGQTAAFYRLAAEIMKSTRDLSILAWHDEGASPGDGPCGALPRDPEWQLYYHEVPRMPTEHPFLMTDRGIFVTARLYPVKLAQGEGYFMCLKDNGKTGKSAGIHLRPVGDDIFQREGRQVIDLDISPMQTPALSTFYIAL